MRKSRLFGIVLVFAAVLGLGSCDRKTAYYHYEHTPLAGWEKSDVLTFDVAPLGAGSYKEEVGVRIDDSFPFMSLSLVVRQTYLPSGYVHSDTVVCNLIDKRGFVKGTGISYYQYLFHINTIRLKDEDSLHITVKHNMKREVMSGISDIGIRLERE